MCIECSGIHRSIGSHITKVRSFSLDCWDDELVELSLMLGNKAVNSILECNKPKSLKLSADADRDERKTYIEKKYMRHDWIYAEESDDYHNIEEVDLFY